MMIKPYLLTLLLILPGIFLLGQYWLPAAELACHQPLTYRIGMVDSRFGLSEADLLAATNEAGRVWNQALGQNVLRYRVDGAVVVNFIYDGRQARTDAAASARRGLNQAEMTVEEIREKYDDLMMEKESRQAVYEEEVTKYKQELKDYNQTVDEANEKGGLNPEEVQAIEKNRVALGKKSTAINQLGLEVEELSEQINQLAEQGNKILSGYNQTVRQYNQVFSESPEFTQGEYSQKGISIYAFSSNAELVQVLAHEFGHALGLGHVDGKDSVMYNSLGEQAYPLRLTVADKEALVEVCNQEERWWQIIFKQVGLSLNNFT